MPHDYLLLDNEMAAAASGCSGGRRSKRSTGSSRARQQRQAHVAASAEHGSSWSSGGWEEDGDLAYSRHRSRKAGKDSAALETLLSRVLNKPKKRCGRGAAASGA
jgi:hypothetical protein